MGEEETGSGRGGDMKWERRRQEVGEEGHEVGEEKETGSGRGGDRKWERRNRKQKKRDRKWERRRQEVGEEGT